VTGVIGPADPAAPTSFALSPDGTRVANARNVQENYDIWLTDVARDISSRFTFDPVGDFSPVWSPDGQQVVFRSLNRQGGGPSDMFIKPANGASDEKVLLATPQAKMPLDWSRDGRHLLYTVGASGQSDIWALPLTGDAKPFAYLQSTFSETQGQFSPDARWVVYTSNESGRDEVYVRAFPVAGGKWQVSTTGGSQPRWSPDGKEIFYLGSEGSLMAVPAAATNDSMTIGASTKLFVPRLATGPGITATGASSRALYAVAPDGRFLFNASVAQSAAAPLSIVQHWELLLAPGRARR
jgi:Tol biopolymer transport system component